MSASAKIKTGWVLASSLILTACAPASLKNINADKPGYLAKNFTLAQLPEDVLAQIKQRPVELKFDTVYLKMKYEVKNLGTDKTSVSTADITYRNLGNGIAQISKDFFSSNDFPLSSEYSLSYLGLLALRYQTVPNNQKTSNMIAEVKHFARFYDNAPPIRPLTTYAVAWSHGVVLQQMFVGDSSVTCTSGKAYPASTLFKSLPGDAIDFNCGYERNGDVDLKETVTYLEHYNMFYPAGSNTADTKAVGTIISFEAR